MGLSKRGMLIVVLAFLSSLLILRYKSKVIGSPYIGDVIDYMSQGKPNHGVTYTPTDTKKKTSLLGEIIKHRKLSYSEEDIQTWLKSVYQLHQKFRSKTSKSCNNKCVFHETICKANQHEHWEALLKSPALDAISLFPNEESIFPWERDYLSHPPLQDIKLLPDLHLSKVYLIQKGVELLSKSGEGNNYLTIKCKKDEKLIFRAELIDGYGNNRRFGGDEVRAWITDVNKTLSMTGAVEDLENGSYLVTVTPAWVGEVKLHIGVTYPREYLRAALYHMKEGRNRFIYGVFKNKSSGASEVTICHTTPNIPGRPCVCNFTTYNRRPYYCGRPLDNRLTCKNWMGIKSASGPILEDFTPAEARMEANMSRPADQSTINHNFIITSLAKEKAADPLPYCNTLQNFTLTWNADSPRGLWRKKKYFESTICKEPMLTSSYVTKCLNSSNIWMIGDSNLDMFDKRLQTYVKLQYKRRSHGWPAEREGINQTYHIKDTFRGHEYPLFHYIAKSWILLFDQHGIEDFFQKIPSTRRQVVIIHYNLHFSISHLSAIFQRLVAVRRAVEDLLVKNPQAVVAIRGPHIATVEWKTNHLFGGDVQGKFILRMLHIVFSRLKEKVIFLDGWDMTISLENVRMHPSVVVVDAMLRTLLALLCR